MCQDMKFASLVVYREFGHKSFKKLVWMNPGSRQPTVRAGGAAHYDNNFVTTMASNHQTL